MRLRNPSEVQSETPVYGSHGGERERNAYVLMPRESLRLVLRERGSIKDYLLAIGSVGIGYALTAALSPHMHRIVTPLFFGAVTLTAWAGGFWPGVVAALLGVA